ncbi:MAG: phosphoribosylformylglycinamidine synthase subunit PurL, partial [Brachybacterium sp.]|nr:phosphoribosylformylglycinamidine synthase subunit PurL [Brachybacterium sp.]
YGNSLGLPNIGGETVFDSAYQTNPLVNALAMGVMRHEDIRLGAATGTGNQVVLFGARTGGDGIGGASILASETFEEDGPVKRPSVQVGDPFMEKVLIECCLELFAADTVEGIQDLGAAGISCATSELAANGGSGMHIHLEEVLLRDSSLNAGEILMSESQERMMAVVSPEKLAEFQAIAAKWDVEAAVIGEVTGDGRLTIDHHGHRIVDVDPATVAIDSPVYDRPYARPDWQDALQADTAEALPRPGTAEELATTLRTLIASPNLASKGWVTDQYDRYVGGNTALAMPDDAGVLRIDESTGRGVALATDANGRYTKLDPRTGAQLALAEAYRNVATSGAVPLAITDCLNFGSPEDPGPMWQLVEAIGGLAEACEALEVPVTGGNVSLYNSTGEPGLIDSAIHPTPVVGVLGVFEDVARRVPSGWQGEGESVLLLGTTREELSGSAWADVAHQHLGGLPPQVDLEAERSLATVLIASAEQGLASAAHDLSEGGLAQALVEAVVRFGSGAQIDPAGLLEREGVDLFTALFSESQARALVSVPTAQEEQLTALAAEHGVPVLRLGTTGGDTLDITGLGAFTVGELRELREGTLPRYFG